MRGQVEPERPGQQVDGQRSTTTTAARIWSADREVRPTIKVIGNVIIAVVLAYGGYRALAGKIDVAVLAAFLLYLRRFFEPMQELSQFLLADGRSPPSHAVVIAGATTGRHAVGADRIIFELPSHPRPTAHNTTKHII